MYSPSFFATLTSEIGPSNGISETLRAADAAKAARESGISPSSADNRLMKTCVSFIYSLGNNGLIALSTSLETNISSSLSLPSLLKKLPGILPAAENFS